MAKKKRKPNSKKPADRKPSRASKPAKAKPSGQTRRPRYSHSTAIEGLNRLVASRGGKRPRSPLAVAQEIADAAWEAARPQDQVALAQHALSVSADCADAYIILANQAESRQQALQLLEEGVAAGQRAIGPGEFESAAGRFWLDQRTRPYMRARLGLAQCLWESGQRDEAAAHYAEMLRLNPNDNQGVRYLFLGALVELDRDAEARQLLASYENDSSAEWTYTAALLGFRGEGDSAASRERLFAALESNEHVPEFLLGHRNMPPMPPSYVSPGGVDEAISYTAQFLRTWRGSPGAIPWLRKTLKVPLPQARKPRKPAWALFRQTFLRLPKVREVWQLDVCRLPAPMEPGVAAHKSSNPWALVIWNQTQDSILAFEAGDDKRSAAETWEVLIEALLRPRPASGQPGEPHRPAEIQVRRRTFYNAWQQKLRQIDIACRLRDDLPELDGVLENLLPASTHVRRFLEGPEEPNEADLEDLAELPQELGETWEADVRLLPGWLEQDGELRRPWASLVTSRGEHIVLTQNLSVDAPPPEWIWKNLVDAMLRPMIGEPHRPGIVEVTGESFHAVLQERLDAVGVRCVLADDLEQINDIFQQLGQHLSHGRAAAALIEVPGVAADDVGSFYHAAAAFYRAAPWRLVPGDTTFKIECPKLQTDTWYGVVMGQSGLVLGLALYEDLGMLRRLFSGKVSDQQMSRQATGLSVMFGEPFEMPIADLDTAERYGWEVAGDEAYPNPIYVNPGRSMRPPLAWELELLEATLRAVPRFLADRQPDAAEYDLPCGRGPVTLRLSLVED